MGRGSRRFRGVKTIIFKGKVVNKWLPVRTTLADLQRLGFEGSWQDEYSFPNSPIFYLYLAGFCVVGGLVIVDVISRFQQQPVPIENESGYRNRSCGLNKNTSNHPFYLILFF